MGYSTEFVGRFKFNQKLDDSTIHLLRGLSETRRMMRHFDGDIYGIDGEFYIDGGGYAGQDRDNSIIDYNRPPRTQPSLWCGWGLSTDSTFLEWNGMEKFYGYVQWLKYLIERVLEPKGYSISGTVRWAGEHSEDTGVISVVDNRVIVTSFSFL